MDAPPVEVGQTGTALPPLGMVHRKSYVNVHLVQQQDGGTKTLSPLRGSFDSHSYSPGAHTASSAPPGGGCGARGAWLKVPDSSLNFEQSVSRDLPPAVRVLVEDNKMLQDEVRRYRQRAGEQAQALAAQERQLVALRDEVLRLHAALRQCSVAPADLMREKSYQQELAQRDAGLRQATQRAGVLERAKEAAERRMRADMAAAVRQREGLQREVARLQQLCQDKDKQARLNMVHVKSLYQRMEVLEAVVGPQATEVAAPKPPQPRPAAAEAAEPEVRLMLCILREEVVPTAAQLEEAAARLVVAEAARQEQANQHKHATACAIQAAARGWLARRRLARQRRAIVLLQAHVRGMLARRRAAALQRPGGGQSASPDLRELSAADRLLERRKKSEAIHAQRALLAKQHQSKRKALPPRASVAQQVQRPANTASDVAARLPRRTEMRGAQGVA